MLNFQRVRFTIRYYLNHFESSGKTQKETPSNPFFGSFGDQRRVASVEGFFHQGTSLTLGTQQMEGIAMASGNSQWR